MGYLILSAAVPIIIAAMTGVATLMIDIIGTTDTGKTGHTVAKDPGRLLAEPLPNLKIVVHPGLHPPGGRLMIKGLQGTMITGEEAMMTAERLIIILNVAGMIMTDAGTTEDATKKMNASRTGLRGTRMGKAVGHLVEWSGLGTSFAAASFG